jgi:hypothetical protein
MRYDAVRSSWLAIGLLLLSAEPAAHARSVVRELSWSELKRSGQLSAGELAGDRLRLVNDQARPRTFHLGTLEKPPIRGLRWGLVGQLRHENVEGPGYLELWSVFATGAYFSRGLASTGPMRSLHGSSGWRKVVLPFFSRPAAGAPQRITINLVLPGRGTVELQPLQLCEFAESEDPRGGAMGWWGDWEGGWIGGIAGSLAGLLAVLLGALVSLGRGRRLAIGLAVLLLVAGALGLAAGGFALLRAQPYAVYYPLLLIGGILTVLMACMLPVIRRRYRVAELRRMAALDSAPARR